MSAVLYEASQPDVVRAFWKRVGGRTPVDSVYRVCDTLVEQLERCVETRRPPFQTGSYEYARLLNIPVIENDIRADGALAYFEDQFVIQVRRAAPFVRRSFTVCHEIGHIQILTRSGCTPPYQIAAGARAYTAEEELADAFAANLLMPRARFREHASLLPISLTSIGQLAQAFSTSFDATSRRIMDLGIWPCALLWCQSRKLFDGRKTVYLRQVLTSNQAFSGLRPGQYLSSIYEFVTCVAAESRHSSDPLVKTLLWKSATRCKAEGASLGRGTVLILIQLQ